MGSMCRIYLGQLVESLNQFLATHTAHPIERQGAARFVEEVLKREGVTWVLYFLSSTEVPRGQLPGCHINDLGEIVFGGTDTTRRRYVMRELPEHRSEYSNAKPEVFMEVY